MTCLEGPPSKVGCYQIQSIELLSPKQVPWPWGGSRLAGSGKSPASEQAGRRVGDPTQGAGRKPLPGKGGGCQG